MQNCFSQWLTPINTATIIIHIFSLLHIPIKFDSDTLLTLAILVDGKLYCIMELIYMTQLKLLNYFD